jgi:hypothetical protein
MRISRDALRVSALVAAGIWSGYLWRAAFEPDRAARSVAAPTQIISVEPFVRPAPSASSAGTSKPASRRTRGTTARPSGGRQRGTAHSPVREPVAQSPRTGSAPKPPAPSPKPPAPTPAPTPPPTPTTQPPSTAPATSTPAPPTVAAAPPNPPAQQPPRTSSNGDSSKEGWGHGDKNHEHTGPADNGKGGKKP